LNAIEPHHILEAANFIQQNSDKKIEDLVRFVQNTTLKPEASFDEIVDFYKAVVEDGILYTVIATGHIRAIISMYALGNAHKDLTDVANATHLLLDWFDDPNSATVLYPALDKLQNRFKSIQNTTAALTDREDNESIYNMQSIVNQLILTGPTNGIAHERYSIPNLTKIKSLRQSLRQENLSFREIADHFWHGRNTDRKDILDQMCKILNLQYSYAKSMGYSSFAAMNLKQSSSMAARLCGVETVQKCLSDLEIILKKQPIDRVKVFMTGGKGEMTYSCNFQTVVTVLLDLCSRLFDLRFEIEGDLSRSPALFSMKDEWVTIHVYDDSSPTYDGKHLGSIILDPYERPGKESAEGFMIPVLNQKIGNKNYFSRTTTAPLTYISLSIPRYKSLFRSSAGMTLIHAQDLFHEFGHALEIILRSSALSGIRSAYFFTFGYARLEQDCHEIVSQVSCFWGICFFFVTF
jgi:Zn-dependent oligopeptidase